MSKLVAVTFCITPVCPLLVPSHSLIEKVVSITPLLEAQAYTQALLPFPNQVPKDFQLPPPQIIHFTSIIVGTRPRSCVYVTVPLDAILLRSARREFSFLIFSYNNNEVAEILNPINLPKVPGVTPT